MHTEREISNPFAKRDGPSRFDDAADKAAAGKAPIISIESAENIEKRTEGSEISRIKGELRI